VIMEDQILLSDMLVICKLIIPNLTSFSGNVVANEKGIANVDITDSVISLRSTHSIIGRSLVVHKDEDDLGLGNKPDSKTTGASGARVACGTIGLKQYTPDKQPIVGQK
jgi:hypothetical protein